MTLNMDTGEIIDTQGQVIELVGEAISNVTKNFKTSGGPPQRQRYFLSMITKAHQLQVNVFFILARTDVMLQDRYS